MSTIYKQNIVSTSYYNLVNWYSESTPQISIIILNFNKAHLTIECLESIWEHTHGFRYEIIVVDNGSCVDDFDKLIAFKGAYTLLRLEVNRFFGEGNNIGAESAKGEFILFMNNDITVTAEWLPPLMNAFDIYSDCGASGPKFLYPEGRLQEAGALLDEEGNAVQIGKYQNPNEPRFCQSRVVDYVSAATVLMRKTIFEEVFGFDFIYEPAYYEDTDLCMKIGQMGLKTYYIAESCVIHHESATTSDLSHGLQLNNIVAVNRDKFITRWMGYLKTGRHELIRGVSRLVPLPKSARHSNGRTAAVYTPYNINPGGGERYLLTIAECLIKAGYQTWLVMPEIFSSLHITKVASIFGVDIRGLGLITTKVAEKMPPFDIFVAMANEIAPPIKAMGQKSFYICQFPFPCTIEEIDRRRSYCASYDSYLVYSDFAKENVLKQFFKYLLPNTKVQILSPPIDLLPFNATKKSMNIISVGRFFIGGHCKQQDMLIRAFRRIFELGIDVQLYLVGSLSPEAIHREYLIKCKELAHGLPVHFYIDASDDMLASLYKDASIYWHGGGFGIDTDKDPEKCEHFGISILEAMSAGVIPIVVNNGGPANTVQHGVSGYCYETEEQLIELTLNIISEQEQVLFGIRNNARNRALLFSKDLFMNACSKIIYKKIETVLLSV